MLYFLGNSQRHSTEREHANYIGAAFVKKYKIISWGQSWIHFTNKNLTCSAFCKIQINQLLCGNYQAMKSLFHDKYLVFEESKPYFYTSHNGAID